ncbi:MAG: Gfo/Idh/MocA family oxidoreductase [bacterium]
MAEKLNAVVVGAGALGRHHARVYAQHENIRLLAIIDIDERARMEHATKWNCLGLASLDELREPVDLASVVVPTVSHGEVALRLIERGVPVLVEKPITLSVEEGRRLTDAAARRNVPIQVGHIERFNPAVIELGRHLQTPLFIESHRLGPPTPRVQDIGVVLDLMIHDLDLILNLVRSEIESIDAAGVPILTPREDIANARLRFQSGCIANVTVSRVTPERQRKIRFFQKDTYFSLDLLKPDLQIYRKVNGPGGTVNIEYEHPALTNREPLALEIDSFIDCVVNHKTPLVTGQDGVRALELAQKITDQVSRVSRTILLESGPE